MQNVGKLGLTVSNKVVQTKHGQNKGIVSVINICLNSEGIQNNFRMHILPRRIMYFVETYPFRIGHDMP